MRDEEQMKPIASRHYDGVKNLYQQEIEILKFNISQCERHDKSIAPTFEEKENILWKSFS